MSGSSYKNLISTIDINRSIDSLDYLRFDDLNKEQKLQEFLNDMKSNNDSIELNLIKNNAYREAIIMSLHMIHDDRDILKEIMKGEQKTFGGSKLFYLNDNYDKILVMAVPGSLDGKLNMVINRLNKTNDHINRLNTRIKKENQEHYVKRKNINDKKDEIINLINKRLKV